MFSMQCRKKITVEDSKKKKKKKKMNTANFINIYIQIYIPTLYVTRITQKKTDLINSILTHGRVVGKNCYVVFPTSEFPYLTLCPKQWK